jgi:hypothetical protein
MTVAQAETDSDAAIAVNIRVIICKGHPDWMADNAVLAGNRFALLT